MRLRAALATFDNVTFFLNSIDVLAGDVVHRVARRGSRYRTLERVEAQTREFLERRSQEEQQAATSAQRVDAAPEDADAARGRN